MRHTFPKTIVVSALIGMGALGVARAESPTPFTTILRARRAKCA